MAATSEEAAPVCRKRPREALDVLLEDSDGEKFRLVGKVHEQFSNLRSCADGWVLSLIHI
eukprot:858601-Alexandrium_andersonii.AAC.1